MSILKSTICGNLQPEESIGSVEQYKYLLSAVYSFKTQ